MQHVDTKDIIVSWKYIQLQVQTSINYLNHYNWHIIMQLANYITLLAPVTYIDDVYMYADLHVCTIVHVP